jgi:hypothetical protein
LGLSGKPVPFAVGLETMLIEKSSL